MSKRFYQMDGGVQYYGLTMASLSNALINERGLPFLGKDGNANLTDPKWADIFRIAKTNAIVQGNWQGAWQGNMNMFTKDKNVAMFAGGVGALLNGAEALEGTLNWDIVTFPRFSDQPAPIVPYTSGVYMVTSQSKHKDEAFDLVTMSIFAGDTDRAGFENPAAMKRNLAAVRNKPIALLPPNRYSTNFSNSLNKKAVEMIAQNKDINTVLRELQEEMQKLIDESK